MLSYDPDTGLFTRNGRRVGNRVQEGYVKLHFERKMHYAHRVAWFLMTGEFPREEIDHINGIRDDNRWCNLREASRCQNVGNRQRNQNNTSGFKGVSWHKRRNKWFCKIRVQNKQISLGYYDTPEEAHEAYKKAALEYFGDFARFS